MNRRLDLAAIAGFFLVGAMPGASEAQIDNFRMSEIDASGGVVEVTNTGPAHVTPAPYPFCHRLNYATSIPLGTSFLAGERKTFAVSSLNATDTDFWLYRATPFFIGANVVHGLDWGPTVTPGRTGLAATEGLWPSATAFAPAPPPGMSLAWDEFGDSPRDWYIDETPTLGSSDSTTPASVPSSLAFPDATQDFEAVPLGDEVFAITDWVPVNTSSTPGIFTVRAVNDVLGVVGARGSSTRWLRIRDQDAGAVQNRFYSLPIVSPTEQSYLWTFWVNLEEVPPAAAAANKPRLTIQHLDGGFANAWGIEFDETGGSIVVTGVGGVAASAPLFSLANPTGVGDWIQLRLLVDFMANTVTGEVHGDARATLPISLSGTADKKTFRFCYRGEGVDNVATMLLDDIRIQVGSAVTDVTGFDPMARNVLMDPPSPNPTGAGTSLRFTLPQETRAELAIYDAAGRRVVTLLNERLGMGPQQFSWDGRDDSGRRLSSGVYFAKLSTEFGESSRKISVVK